MNNIKLAGKKRSGANNHMSKYFLVISPFDEIFELNGNLAQFAKEHNFFPSTLYYFVNKGKIQQSTAKCTTERQNMVGWEIKEIQK